MRNLLGIALLATTLAFSQEHPAAAHEPAGDATGHAQGAIQPSASPEQHHAQQEAKHGEAHAEGEAPMPNEIWWKWANFAILAGVLGWLIKKNAGPFFQARSQAIQTGIAEATRTREEAEARAAEIERRVSNLSAEVQSLRERSADEIARESERVRAETETQIRKIQTQAENEIASAAKHASADLKAYAAQLALELAERQVQDRLTPQTQDQLVDSFTAELKQKAVTH